MDPVTSVRTCFTKYATFDGRATRSEFWWFYLFTVIVIGVLYVFPFFFSVLAGVSRDTGIAPLFSIMSLISNLALFAASVAVVIPLLAAGCRRLHDRGQSGWLQMLLLVPCGSIVLIVFWILEGNPGVNMYGPPAA
jgi:uncharacterized membrane protein YhaH (DUF805 family)